MRSETHTDPKLVYMARRLHDHASKLVHAGQSESVPRRRDTVYTEYASFVGFLVDRYGVERFEELVKTIPGPDPTRVITIMIGPGIPTPTPWPTPDPAYEPPMADYRAVYGRRFEELQMDWLGLLRAG